MALFRAAAPGGLWCLGPTALSPPQGRMQPQLALAVSRSQLCSQVRSSQVRSLSSRTLVAAVAGAAQWVSARYEQYLQSSFPRFHLLYSTFKRGVQALWLEVKEIHRIRAKMWRQRLSRQQLPYREMERLRPVSPGLPLLSPAHGEHGTHTGHTGREEENSPVYC